LSILLLLAAAVADLESKVTSAQVVAAVAVGF
jgi:hypothetical protein